jgi:DNA-binding response OmpR family regulator/anti-sigma regulatory factor (Ser/Thr protein kinase)
MELKTPRSESEESPKICIVDDQQDSVRFLELVLQSSGMECTNFNSGAALLDYLCDNEADVVILDVIMPEMDGYEVCRRLKANEKTKDIPVIFLTSKLAPEDRIHGLDMGGHDYIFKPPDPKELKARTQAALRVKRLQDALKGKLQLQEENNALQQGMLGEHWEKTFGQLAASLAHEINNPLAAALGMVQLLTLKDSFGGETDDRLKLIDTSLQQAGRKLRSLLLIAQIGQKQQEIALSDLMEDMVTLTNYSMVSNKVVLEKEFDKDCKWVGVPSDLARALLYILNNSVEAVVNCDNAVISMRLICHPGGSQVIISDTGSGISADVGNRITEPFFSTKGRPHNGVGLYLATEILDHFNAGIEFKSPAEAFSTEVTVTLPSLV